MVSSGLNRVGTFLAGLFFMLLALFLMVPLPIDGSWEWLPFPFSPYLEFIVGIPLFALSLFIAVDSLKKPTHTDRFPIIDEWIGEQGKEQQEVSEARRNLKQGEELLAIVAGRTELQSNRLALTDERVILYSQKNIGNGLSVGYGEIINVRRRREPVLTHLGELELLTKKTSVKLQKVGMGYAKQIVELINERRLKMRK